ncbi:MAG: hypothetical protein HZB13_00100 [Acidobacteria bacterium]|nr:hypothetical protein [Acidobacteriota bacterium]
MSRLNGDARKALLYELDGTLGNALGKTLDRCGWEPVTVASDQKLARAEIVFCNFTREVLAAALCRFKNLPVVVVSRLPEVDGWLDALEAGAADYCAAPFDAVQIGWLLDTHTGGRERVRHAAAAA